MLDHIRAQQKIKAPENMLPAYLRLKQKLLDKDEWMVQNANAPLAKQVHNGAHFPQTVFTNNSSSRSKAAEERRRTQRPFEKQAWAQTTVAEGKRRFTMSAVSHNQPAFFENKT